MSLEPILMSKALDAVYGSLEKPTQEAEQELIALRALLASSNLQRDAAQGELDEIRDLLPDESPCKHEQTGCSLYDDIQELVLRADGNTKIYNAIFGELHKAGFHNGTVLDKVRAAIAKATEHCEDESEKEDAEQDNPDELRADYMRDKAIDDKLTGDAP